MGGVGYVGKQSKIGYNWIIKLLNNQTKIVDRKREKFLGFQLGPRGKSQALTEILNSSR